MTEGGTDLRILTSRTSNEILSDVRGTKRKLEVNENIEDNVETQRIERPSAPKRRRHSNDGVVGVVKKNLNRVYECKLKSKENEQIQELTFHYYPRHQIV